MRYAQEYIGQRLHLVEEYPENSVSTRALCGRDCLKRGSWRLTSNVPWGNGCKTCIKLAKLHQNQLPAIGVTMHM